jgi:hypothetical protein
MAPWKAIHRYVDSHPAGYYISRIILAPIIGTAVWRIWKFVAGKLVRPICGESKERHDILGEFLVFAAVGMNWPYIPRATPKFASSPSSGVFRAFRQGGSFRESTFLNLAVIRSSN